MFIQKLYTYVISSPQKTINNTSQTQHDLGMYNAIDYIYDVYVAILHEGSPHDVETSV